ncbi:MAG: HD domain-containing protein [bacterium]|nr:HD domain-containing protein [bacterium]
MDKLHRFLRLVQTTRAMPQTGYVISGIQKAELSDLAQHHYLVTITGWYIAKLVRQKGGKVDLERVLEICLIHDLGELFGGDIAMPYAKANPKARKLAKQFEQENQRFLARFLTDINQVEQLFRDTLIIGSVESTVAKVADYIEVTEYKNYIGRLTEGDITMVVKKMTKMLSGLKNKRVRNALSEIINDWSTAISARTENELFEEAKKG